MIKKIRQFLCFHKFEMTDEAKKIPSVNPSKLKDGEIGVEIREHECTKCEKTRMLTQCFG